MGDNKQSKTASDIFQNLREKLVVDLLTYVDSGDLEQVEAMLDKEPELLLETGISARDMEEGVTTKRTAYQIALGKKDVEMCQMMIKYFARLKNGEAEKKKQFDTLFTNTPEHTPWEYDFSSLVTAITDDKLENNELNSNTITTLEKFRADFKTRTGEDINEAEGFTVNVQTLLDALVTYKLNYNQWNDPQRALFHRHVFGYLQRFIPGAELNFNQGLYSAAASTMPLSPKSNLSLNPNLPNYFPLNPNFEVFDNSNRKIKGTAFQGPTLSYPGSSSSYQRPQSNTNNKKYESIVDQLIVLGYYKGDKNNIRFTAALNIMGKSRFEFTAAVSFDDVKIVATEMRKAGITCDAFKGQIANSIDVFMKADEFENLLNEKIKTSQSNVEETGKKVTKK